MAKNATLATLKKRKPTVADYQEAIEKSAGIIAAAARRLGVDRATLYRKLAKSPSLQTTLHEARQSTIDLAESKLLEAIQAGNLTAVIFYLKTVGKDRGYVEALDLHTRVEEQVQAQLDEFLAEVRASVSPGLYGELQSFVAQRLEQDVPKRQPN